MLRRVLGILLTVTLTAGFALPAPAQQAIDGEQLSLQAPAEGCNGDATAGTTCIAACHAGGCITPYLAMRQADATAPRPVVPYACLERDGARAPDTAPPKQLIF